MSRRVLLVGTLVVGLSGVGACRCRWSHEGESADRSREGSEVGRSQSSDHWLIKTYDVPPQDAVALLSQLRDLFIVPPKGDKGGNYAHIARANLAPDGKLVVVGDGDIQDGVKELVAGLAGHHLSAPRSVTTTYWLVTGRPAKSDKSPSMPEDLKPVADALLEVAHQTGSQEFSLWERLELVSNGSQTWLDGRHTSIRQEATIGLEKVELSTHISASRLSEQHNGPNSIDTRIEIAPDQTVVLAQTGFDPSEPLNAPSGNDPPMSLYYLVRASVRNADSRPR